MSFDLFSRTPRIFIEITGKKGTIIWDRVNHQIKIFNRQKKKWKIEQFNLNNLMSMYLAIELQSLSLYVAAAIKRDSVTSAESGVKYFILGALSSGILLYGCSLIYGFTGSMNFNEINFYLLKYENLNMGLIFGLVFVMVGLAFKISAVPFHMWTPDVYEGAPNSVTAFFAIVPKIVPVDDPTAFILLPA